MPNVSKCRRYEAVNARFKHRPSSIFVPDPHITMCIFNEHQGSYSLNNLKQIMTYRVTLPPQLH